MGDRLVGDRLVGDHLVEDLVAFAKDLVGHWVAADLERQRAV